MAEGESLVVNNPNIYYFRKSTVILRMYASANVLITISSNYPLKAENFSHFCIIINGNSE